MYNRKNVPELVNEMTVDMSMDEIYNLLVATYKAENRLEWSHRGFNNCAIVTAGLTISLNKIFN
jgi:hypothetical protein